ncbi:uncharacterized protein LOC116340487 [Contarinia nasturtii]|uniref:uncharacterized protein LOC116340487 n=1 Tax=Contarinia nasturtii TaxID=265458 RepID=UPI0012D37CB9|nr:uncharacterized protein LOC116340487 [Contarinia nasturtii]
MKIIIFLLCALVFKETTAGDDAASSIRKLQNKLRSADVFRSFIPNTNFFPELDTAIFLLADVEHSKPLQALLHRVEKAMKELNSRFQEIKTPILEDISETISKSCLKNDCDNTLIERKFKLTYVSKKISLMTSAADAFKKNVENCELKLVNKMLNGTLPQITSKIQTLLIRVEKNVAVNKSEVEKNIIDPLNTPVDTRLGNQLSKCIYDHFNDYMKDRKEAHKQIVRSGNADSNKKQKKEHINDVMLNN